MNWLKFRMLLGLFLILSGILFLLQNFEIIPESGALWGITFALGAGVFFILLLGARDRWWAAFPAFVLAGVALIVLLQEFALGLDCLPN